MYYEVEYSADGTVIVSAESEDEAAIKADELIAENGLECIDILAIKEVKE